MKGKRVVFLKYAETRESRDTDNHDMCCCDFKSSESTVYSQDSAYKCQILGFERNQRQQVSFLICLHVGLYVSEQRALFHKCRSLDPKMTTGIFYISVNA
jgi:hypothetical protein